MVGGSGRVGSGATGKHEEGDKIEESCQNKLQYIGKTMNES